MMDRCSKEEKIDVERLQRLVLEFSSTLDREDILTKLPRIAALVEEWLQKKVIVRWWAEDRDDEHLLPEYLAIALQSVVERLLSKAYWMAFEAQFQIETLAKVKYESREANELLESLIIPLQRLGGIEAASVALDLASACANKDASFGSRSDFARSSLQGIAEQATTLRRAINRFYLDFPAKPAPRSNRKLGYYFIEAMAEFYTETTGKRPGKGNRGPFVNLIAAAWQDFDWPVPDKNRDDVLGWLGEQVARHPAVRENGC